MSSQTDAVRSFDEQALDQYIRDALPTVGALRSVKKLSGGQSNPTFLVDTETRQLVLRRKPPGILLKSAHAVDREYRAMKALQGTDVPVPQMHAYCDDETILGSEFFLMDFISGRTQFNNGMESLDDTAIDETYDDMNRVLAALHTLDVDALGLGDFGPREHYFDRQVKRWTAQYEASATGPLPSMDRLMDWINNNIPAEDSTISLIHGDYRLDNMILHADRNEIVAVVDWELSTLGNPLADLAYLCALWRLPPGPMTPGRLQDKRGNYRNPQEDVFLEKYWARRGIAPSDDWTFALAFSLFRLAAILQGVKKRSIEGNASSRKADAVVALIEPSINLALDLIA